MRSTRTVDTYIQLLLYSIAKAKSSSEIGVIITSTIEAFKAHGIHTHLIVRFIDKILFRLRHIDSTELEVAIADNFLCAATELQRAKTQFYSINNE